MLSMVEGTCVTDNKLMEMSRQFFLGSSLLLGLCMQVRAAWQYVRLLAAVELMSACELQQRQVCWSALGCLLVV